MAFKVEWSARAVANFEKVIDYLLEEWSDQVALAFETKVNERISLLANGLVEGVAARKKPAVKSVAITHRNRLYYKIKDDILQIVLIWDNRRHPSKNPFD